jgi:plastocyanin
MKGLSSRLSVAVLAVALLAGCGGGSSSAQPAGSFKVTMTEFHFEPSTLKVPPGKVVFYLVNAGNNTSHDLVIRDAKGARLAGSELISAGDTTVFTVDSIAAGEYTYFCDQPGHEGSGMKGTLTVSSS